MSAKDTIYKDVEGLDEKLQSLRARMTVEQYEMIKSQLAEIKRLGMELPDSGYMASVGEIINRISKIEYGKLSESAMKESIKDLKKVGFLARLEYIGLSTKNGVEVKNILLSAREYWESIKGSYDGFEAEEIKRKLDEVELEASLSTIRKSKRLELSEIQLSENYYLIRERLQSILDDKSTNKETKMLVNSWLGESIDIDSGKIDTDAMRKIVSDNKLWEVLSGVKGVLVNQSKDSVSVKNGLGKADSEPLSEEVRDTHDRDEEKNENDKPKRDTNKRGGMLLANESEERQNAIKELSKKYGIPLRKFDFKKKKFAHSICVQKYYRFGKVKYRLVSAEEAYKTQKDSEIKNIVAMIYNNSVSDIGARGTRYIDLEDVVFSDNLVYIGQDTFRNTKLKQVTCPKALKFIGVKAFYNSRLLETVKLNEGLEKICSGAFCDCNVKEIEIPGSVRQIDDFDFAGNPLSSVTFNDGLKSIFNAAFRGCRLSEVRIPKTTEFIGKSAFAENYLKKVKVPRGIQLESDAFGSDAELYFDGYEEYEPNNEADLDGKSKNAIDELQMLSEEKKRLEAELKRINERVSEINRSNNRKLGPNK